MKCSNCGSEIGEEDKFCTKCGQAITSQNSTPGVPKNNKKNNIGLVIGVVILAVIALIAVVTVLDTKENESEGNGQEPIINENTNDEKSGEVETPTTVEFNGYTFAVPSNVTASVSDDKLFVYGPGSKWVGVVMTQTGSYNTLVSMKDQIKVALAAQEGADKYEMSNAVTEEKEYAGKPFLITRGIKTENYDLDISYGKADEENVYVISITKSDGTELTETERTEMYTLVASGQK